MHMWDMMSSLFFRMKAKAQLAFTISLTFRLIVKN